MAHGGAYADKFDPISCAKILFFNDETIKAEFGPRLFNAEVAMELADLQYRESGVHRNGQAETWINTAFEGKQ